MTLATRYIEPSHVVQPAMNLATPFIEPSLVGQPAKNLDTPNIEPSLVVQRARDLYSWHALHGTFIGSATIDGHL